MMAISAQSGPTLGREGPARNTYYRTVQRLQLLADYAQHALEGSTEESQSHYGQDSDECQDEGVFSQALPSLASKPA
jgi:hypothetical protein